MMLYHVYCSFSRMAHFFGSIRQALRYVIRNTSLPQRVRAKAQLELSQMHAYTRPTQIKNRCVAGGIARSVFRDFRLARVRLVSFTADDFVIITVARNLPRLIPSCVLIVSIPPASIGR
jgi:ribosomal protein S14